METCMTVDANCEPSRARWIVRRKVLYIALAICLVNYALKEWVLWPVRITGESMLPNYTNGQLNYINKLAYITQTPQRGDVVGVKVKGNEVYLKRIVGLPGEKIDFEQGKVIVNGEEIKEPYPVKTLLWVVPSFHLGPNEFFVMGDNRRVSLLGPVSRDNIIGRAIF